MTRLAVDFDWEPAGRVTLDREGRLVFPSLDREPGLYCFWIESGDDRPAVYVGEASELRRRMQHYRTPGIRQATNLRLRELLTSALRSGSVVTVLTIREATVSLDSGLARPLPLDRRNGRLIAEQAAIATLLVENLSDDDTGPAILPRLLDRPGVGEAEYE